MFERYEVLQFWSSSDICPDQCGETFVAFASALAREGLDYQRLECGDQRRIGALLWTVLSPSEVRDTPASSNDNGNSLVLLLQYGSASFLFAGDLQSASEEEIWQIVLPRGPIAALLPHHAMDECVSERFLQWAHPELVVVSSDANDPDPGVISTLQEKSLRHFATFRDGTICIFTDGCTFSERTER